MNGWITQRILAGLVVLLGFSAVLTTPAAAETGPAPETPAVVASSSDEVVPKDASPAPPAGVAADPKPGHPAAGPSRSSPHPPPGPPAPPAQSASDRVLPPEEVDGEIFKNREAEIEEADEPPLPLIGLGEKQIPQSEKDVPPGLSGRVQKYIRYFQNTGRKRFEVWLSRSGKYSDMMRGILNKYGLPGDLVYLALIESGFSPNAYSVARAAGPWQFISGTARRYGLRIDWWTDERRDYEKSTHAAASYLKDLYGLFESWDLAAAAYNAGEGKIMRAVSKYKSEDYTELIRYRYLKAETRDYVPKMYAALSIAKEPEKYGFDNVRYDDPLQFDKVEVPGGTDLDALGKIIGLPYGALREWNPELRRFCTPPNQPTYMLRLPRGYGAVAQERMDDIRTDAKVTFVRHTVRKGETLQSVAAKYGTPAPVLKEMNGLKKSSVRRMASLVIPVVGLSDAESVPGTALSPAQIQMAHMRVEERVRRARSRHRHRKVAGRGNVVVRKGDTLSGIAKRNGVSEDALARANGLGAGHRLKAGKTLRLPARKIKSSGKAGKRSPVKKKSPHA